jgi:transposase
MDLRLRILADSDAGMKTKAVALKYSVSESWVRRLKQRRRETGEVAPREQRHGPLPSWEEQQYAQPLRAAVDTDPDATLEELQARLNVGVAISTLWRACAALELSFKKK